MINMKRLLLPPELRLDYSLTKSQSNWMCGLYYCRYACLSFQVCLSFCTRFCLCIALPFISTLGGGDVKVVPHNSSIKPCAYPRFTWYTRVYYINPAQMY